MILLDTNVVSEPLKPEPAAAVTEWLDRQSIETLYLTTITVAEIRFGISCIPAGRRKATLNRRFETQVLPLFLRRIVSFDDAATTEYAARRSAARRGGLAVGDFDSLIAAIAGAGGFTVATRDRAPFDAMGVPVINPFEE